MKKIVLAALVAMSINNVPAYAGTTLELRANFKPGTASQLNINIFSEKMLNPAIGVWSFLTITDTYAEAVMGPVIPVTDWLTLYPGLGIETANPSYREVMAAWVGMGKVSFFGWVEDGGSGFWHFTKTMVKLTDNVSVGVRSQSFKGIGPQLTVSPLPQMSIWVAPMYDPPSGQIRTVGAIQTNW